MCCGQISLLPIPVEHLEQTAGSASLLYKRDFYFVLEAELPSPSPELLSAHLSLLQASPNIEKSQWLFQQKMHCPLWSWVPLWVSSQNLLAQPRADERPGKGFCAIPLLASLAVRAVFMEFKDKPSQNVVPPSREPRVQAPHRIFHLQAGM